MVCSICKDDRKFRWTELNSFTFTVKREATSDGGLAILKIEPAA